VPTKKQRRRQQKNRRHEWEYVYVDEEGQEVDLDPAERRATKKDDQDRDKERPRASGTTARRTDARGRPVRQIEPPSWRRVFKRALIFGPIFIVALALLNRGSILQAVAQAVPLLVFFIPFSYFTDWLAYRTYQKRLARAGTAAPKSSAGSKPAAKPKTR
jgi:hypothetical protein